MRLLLRALAHYEEDSVDLVRVVGSNSFNNCAILEVPDDNGAVFRPRSHESVALAHSDVDDDVQVTVQTRLEDHGLLAPHLDDARGR